MRVLLTTAPGAGHLFPAVPLVSALRGAGHEILLATTGPGTVLGPSAGLATVDVAPGVDIDDVIASAVRDSGGFAIAEGDRARERAVSLFAAVGSVMLAGIRRCVDLWEPDVVVYEGLCGAGAAVAAERGVAGVAHGIGWAAPPQALVEAMWPALTGGGSPVAAVAAIGLVPPSLGPVPDPGWAMRPVPYTGGAVVPTDVLTAPARPRVLVTMGTVAPRLGGFGLLRELVLALSAEPIELLAALGGDPAEMGELPPSVRLHRWVPLSAALPHCAVVVHHGGAGTCLAAMAAGVGQVIIPQGADQFLNADALVARGCAVRSGPEPGDVRTAVRHVLSGALHDPVTEIRREITDMAPPSVVAQALVTLLARRQHGDAERPSTRTGLTSG